MLPGGQVPAPGPAPAAPTPAPPTFPEGDAAWTRAKAEWRKDSDQQLEHEETDAKKRDATVYKKDTEEQEKKIRTKYKAKLTEDKACAAQTTKTSACKAQIDADKNFVAEQRKKDAYEKYRADIFKKAAPVGWCGLFAPKWNPDKPLDSATLTCDLSGLTNVEVAVGYAKNPAAARNDDPGSSTSGVLFSASAMHTAVFNAVPNTLQLKGRLGVLIAESPPNTLPGSNPDVAVPSGEGGATNLARLDRLEVIAAWTALKSGDYKLAVNGTLGLVSNLNSSWVSMGVDGDRAIVYTPAGSPNATRATGLLANVKLTGPRGLDASLGSEVTSAKTNFGYDGSKANPDGTSGKGTAAIEGFNTGVWGMFKIQPVKDHLTLGIDGAYKRGSGDADPPGPASTPGAYNNSLVRGNFGVLATFKPGGMPVSIGAETGASYKMRGNGQTDQARWAVALAGGIQINQVLAPYLRYTHSQMLDEHAFPGGFSGEAPAAVSARRNGGQTGLGGDAPVELPPEDPTGPDPTRTQSKGLVVDEFQLGLDISLRRPADGEDPNLFFRPSFAAIRSSETYTGAAGQWTEIFQLVIGGNF